MSYNSIIAGIGIAVIIPIIYFISIAFPSPKQAQGFPIKEGLALLKQPALILLGFILFFESGLEGIVGNWTTSFMKDGLNLTTENALFALSSQVIALAIARLILGGVLKKVKPGVTLFICYAFILAGGIIMLIGATFFSSVIALIFIGIGFAAGFPVILGYVGELYANLSGTAFSVVLVMALTGNTLINYLVGAVAQSYGIQKFPIILVICVVIMALLLSVSLSKISTKK